MFEAGEYFDPGFRCWGDFEFVPRVLRKGYRAHTVRKPLSVFTMTGKNRGLVENVDINRDRERIRPHIPVVDPPIQVPTEAGTDGDQTVERCILSGTDGPLRDLCVGQGAPTATIPCSVRVCNVAGWLGASGERPMIVDSVGPLQEECPESRPRRWPRVSVVMPVYNAAPYIERACGSALAQTMPDLEVVIVDDGSTDGTAAIAERLASVDGRVRLLRNERNQGEPYSRMRAHAAALGEWLAPLDGDDAWLPDRLERMLCSPGADEADAISDDVLRVEADGRAWRCLHHRWQRPLVLGPPRWLDARDMVSHHLGVLQPLMRRQFLETHGLGVPDAPVANDLYLYLEMMLAGARWLQVPGAYYLYYVTSRFRDIVMEPARGQVAV